MLSNSAQWEARIHLIMFATACRLKCSPALDSARCRSGEATTPSLSESTNVNHCDIKRHVTDDQEPSTCSCFGCVSI
jgi:hypothetical protein